MTRAGISRWLAGGGIVLFAVGVLLVGVRFPYTNVARATVALGLLALIAFAVLNPREVVAWSSRRSARRGTGAIFGTLLFTAILVTVQAISLRHIHQFDVTRNQRFTLAPQTLQVLDSLKEPLTITAFYRPTASQRRYVEELLALYVNHTSMLRYEFIDPDKKPMAAEQLSAGYGDVVIAGPARRRIVSDPNEQTMTNALLQVSRNQFKHIYFTSGHSEKRLDDKTRGGYSAVSQSLGNQGYVPRDLALIDVEHVPEDCDLLVIAGPRKAFLPDELARVEQYLREGGHALFLMDPRVDLPGIETILATYNIALDPVVLLDENELVGSDQRVFDATVTKIRHYENHTITRGFNIMTMYPMARPVRLIDKPNDFRVTGQYLATTGRTSWGETDMESFKTGRAVKEAGDYAPPLAIAAVVTKTPPLTGDSDAKESRIIVFGDSDWLNNAFYGLLGNSDLFLNCVNYLTRDEDLISIRPRSGLGDRVYITEAQGRLIFALCVILLPLSAVVVGGFAFNRRRRA